MAKKLPVIVTEEEFTKLIAHTKQKHHKIAFLFGFGAGLRVSEVVSLEQRDINLKERKVLIRQAKGSKDRIVPLPKGFKQNMIGFIPIKCGIRALQKAFKNSCRKSGLLETKPTIHFHSLRHGFCSRLANLGVPIHHIRTLAGHSNISTTNIYLEANPKEALKKYEELF